MPGVDSETLLKQLSEGQPRGFPFGDFSVEDVMIDGDMGIASDEDEADGDEVPADSLSMNHVLVVDGLPVVDSSKYERLTKILSKIVTAAGPVQQVVHPVDSAGMSKVWTRKPEVAPAQSPTLSPAHSCTLVLSFSRSQGIHLRRVRRRGGRPQCVPGAGRARA